MKTVGYQQKLGENKKFIKVYASKDTSFAIDEDGNLYSWGRNWGGLLGINNSDDNYYTNELQKINLTSKAVDIVGSATGDGNVAILDENGCVWTIGNDSQIVYHTSRLPYKQEINAKIKSISIGRILFCIDVNNDTWIVENCYGEVRPTQKTTNLWY